MEWQDKRVKYAAIFTATLLAIVSWRIYSNVSTNREKARKASERRPTVVRTVKSARQSIKPVVKLSGSLEPIWQADVASKVVARLSTMHVDVGDKVTKGQLLAEMEQTDLAASASTAKGSYYDAEATAALARILADRNKKLYEYGALSRQELDNTQYARDMAQGKLTAAKGTYDLAQSKLEGTNIRAPHAGTIVKRYYQEGYYAKEGVAIYNIADTSSLKVKIDIPEGQIAYVAKGIKTKIKIPALGKEVDGTMTKLSPVADLPARTFAAEVTVPNPNDAIKGGVHADVYIVTKEKDNVLTIPMSCIVMREDQRTVYVVDAEDKVLRKVVDTGYIGDGLVEVLSGLSEGEEVVLTGQNRLREGMKITREKGESK